MSAVSDRSPAEELAAFLARGPSPSEIASFRLSDASLARADELMDKTKDGTLTPDEGQELDRLILLDDVIGLIQSQVQSPSNEEEGVQRPDTQDTGLNAPSAPSA